MLTNRSIIPTVIAEAMLLGVTAVSFHEAYEANVLECRFGLPTDACFRFFGRFWIEDVGSFYLMIISAALLVVSLVLVLRRRPNP